ncbi:MAG: hypothetical protein A2W25_14210 [candidate division Zixibacteria bacterium RBG_16_53_22]|nr:MAG: hypothetical protein A2W25_14210 [candidate division Zixibacteria bacterium RBG_16_53_22]
MSEATYKARLYSSATLGVKRGIGAFLQLSAIMVPVYVVVALLKLTPAIDFVSGLFEPIMVYFGLPGESALAYVTGSFVNLYAALAVIAGLELTARQITILAIMLGVSHSQIMESAILAKMNARPLWISLARVAFSFICGVILNLIIPA